MSLDTLETQKTEFLLPVIKEIIEALDEMQSYKYNDYGDLGSWLGEAIRKHCTEEELKNFSRGFEHGVSLTDGTHDTPPSPEEQKRLDELNSWLKNEFSKIPKNN